MSLNPNILNGAALAYIGDAIYESYVRQHVLESGMTDPNRLHKASVKYVEAKGQAYVIQHWLHKDENYLSEKEISIYKRGRNHKANTKAKNATIGEYRQATGFEALIGWLYLNEETKRLNELIQYAFDLIEKRGE